MGNLPNELRNDAEMYAGCVAGAIQKSEYLGLIADNGFVNITLQKEKPITIPNDILGKYLSEEEMNAFNHGGTGIFSITVYAEKPINNAENFITKMDDSAIEAACCSPKDGCC